MKFSLHFDKHISIHNSKGNIKYGKVETFIYDFMTYDADELFLLKIKLRSANAREKIYLIN